VREDERKLRVEVLPGWGSLGGDFVRSGPGTVKLPPDSADAYIRTRFPGVARSADSRSEGVV
jgi:hypothetical protein